ncbi:MAG: zinc-binding dehydrogenase [Gammaproteobacteria bacterium]
MRGVVFTGNSRLEMRQFPDPTPGAGEVVLEMKASGMCGSDLKFYRPPPGAAFAAIGIDASKLGPELADGLIAGHEPCGVVAAVGASVDPRSFKIGDRVMVHHYYGCRVCDACRTGWSQMCEEGPVVYGVTGHGGHADYMKVPAATLVHLPAELSYATGAAISCGTGTAFGALVRLELSARDTIAIFGLGPVGLAAVQFAHAMGARIIAVDIAEARVTRAREFGADEALDSTQVDVVAEILRLTGGKGVSCALDASGAPDARQAAVQATGRWGRVVLVGEGGELTLAVSRDMIRKQITIMGSWTFSTVGQRECTRFVAEHGIDVERVFTERWRLDQAEAAYASFDKQSGGKGVFEFP